MRRIEATNKGTVEWVTFKNDNNLQTWLDSESFWARQITGESETKHPDAAFSALFKKYHINLCRYHIIQFFRP